MWVSALKNENATYFSKDCLQRREKEQVGREFEARILGICFMLHSRLWNSLKL
jgi:hypothetical protein